MKQNSNINVAVIDLGTLKIKFEVREYKRDGSWSVILKQKVLTVLARNLDKNQGMIHRKSIENTINVLKGFMKSLNDMNIKQYEAVTTEVIRKARNSQTVLQEIYERTGIRFNVLGHKEEGEIYFRSVSHDFPNKNIAVVDVGGGSVFFTGGIF